MRAPLFHIVFCIALLFGTPPIMAQEGEKIIEPPQETTTITEPADEYESGTERYQVYEKRYFDRNRLNELKNLPEFNYDKPFDSLTMNLREISDREYFSDSNRRRNRSERNSSNENRGGGSKNRDNSNSTTPSGSSFSWLMMLLIFVGLVAILMFALKLNPGGLFSRRASKPVAAEEEPGANENIHAMKFETELEKAIRLKNFRLALRILYLETLKKMTDRNIISWRPEKTNWEYVREIKDASVRTPFAEITNAFDYAWYGEFNIDEPLFRMMQDKMLRFRQKL
ncbi:MAG: DUF4129 domain-containing protein [Dinghuibacter sp.]|nr:DUF4129 domain-containing protein [Dinghuibacter sp.]